MTGSFPRAPRQHLWTLVALGALCPAVAVQGQRGSTPHSGGVGPAAKQLPLPLAASESALRKYVEELRRKVESRDEDASHKKSEADRGSHRRGFAGHGKSMEREEDSGVDFWGAYLYFLHQRSFPHDSINWSVYPDGIAHRAQMPRAIIGSAGGGFGARGLGSKWSFMGPHNLPVPYQIYYGQGNISGRVNALAFDPTHAGTYYLGAAGGGLWKSTDSGAHWAPLSDAWRSLQVSSIAVDPTNSNILYVGTGDFDGFGGLGFGIMKSTDGGTTWSVIGGSQFAGLCVKDILIDPEDHNTITVAPGRFPVFWGKIWQSRDGGTTWTQVLSTSAPWDAVKYGAKSASGQRYYYAAASIDGGLVGPQLWRSADRGATWTQLTAPSTTRDYYNPLAIAPSVVDPNTVYLMVPEDNKIFKSTDAGGTWTDITATFPNGSGSYNWSQYYYDAYLAASSRNVGGVPTDVLYAGLITIAQAPTGTASWVDVGQTFSNSARTHNDQHSWAFDPLNPNQGLFGNDGGVYGFAYDPSSGTVSFNTSLSQNLGITQFYRMDAHPTNPNILVGGCQDNATPVSTGDLANWTDWGGGDGGFVAINRANPLVQYTTSQYLEPIYQTTDGWKTENYDYTVNNSGENVAFIAPIALDPSNPSVLYAGTNHLWKYDNATKSWTPDLGGQALSTGGTISYIAVAPSDSQRIYTGSDRGELWMSTNGGTSWQEINSGTTPLPTYAITSIAVDPSNPSKIYVGLSGTDAGEDHMWRCDNTTSPSLTWVDISGTGATALPHVPLNGIALDIDDPVNVMYVATDIGVFSTTSAGTAWNNATAPLGLPNVQVNDVKAVPGTRSLYAATYGRGIWRIDLPAPVPGLRSLTPSSGAQGTAFTLTVNGSNFVKGATVLWNGSSRTTTFVSSSQLTASIAAADVSAAGPAQVSVRNPSPGGGLSNALTYVIGQPSLTVSVTMSRSGGNITVNVKVTNSGHAVANNVTVNFSRLKNTATQNAVSGSPSTLSLGSIAVGTSSSGSLTFSSTVGTTGQTASLSLRGIYTGGTFSMLQFASLP